MARRAHKNTIWLALALSCGVVLPLMVVVSPTAQAQTLAVQAPPQADLDAKAAQLSAALKDKRYGALVADIPPKLLTVIAARAGMTAAELQPVIERQIETMMKNPALSIDAFEVGTGQISKLANDVPYALLPTVVRMTVEGKTATSNSHILAIVDEGRWYLLRVSEQQWPLFVEAYPAYAAVVIPKEKLEFAK